MQSLENRQLDFRLFLFPPWHVARMLYNKQDSVKKTERFIFLCWISAQWLLLFLSGSNILVNLLLANLGIVAFLVANPYAYIKVNSTMPYSPYLEKHGYIISILVACSTILLMYGSAEVPQFIIMNFRRAHLHLPYVFFWSVAHKIAAWLLISAWIAFCAIDRHALFSFFPKYDLFKEDTREEATHGLICYVLFLYIVGTVFSATRLSKYLLF